MKKIYKDRYPEVEFKGIPLLLLIALIMVAIVGFFMLTSWIVMLITGALGWHLSFPQANLLVLLIGIVGSILRWGYKNDR